MPRLMSVALTERAVVERRKTVTRRLGWRNLTPGTELELCRKVMGRKRPDGSVEPLVRLCRVRVLSSAWERLDAITDADVALEGFDRMHPGPLMLNDIGRPFTPAEWFVVFFCYSMKVTPDTMVNRIEWEYLDCTCPHDLINGQLVRNEDLPEIGCPLHGDHDADY